MVILLCKKVPTAKLATLHQLSCSVVKCSWVIHCMQYIVAVQKYGLKSVYCIHVFMYSWHLYSIIPVSPYSVGIEDVKDLIQDLQQALDKI